jgi:hypothetical protein
MALCGSLDPDAVAGRLREADVLVHAEAFGTDIAVPRLRSTCARSWAGTTGLHPVRSGLSCGRSCHTVGSCSRGGRAAAVPRRRRRT